MTHIAVVNFKASGNGLKVIDRTGWGLRLLCLRSHFLLNHFPTEENWALFWHTTVFNFSYQKLLLPLQRLQRYFYRVNQRGWIACLVTGETVQIRCLIFVIPVHTGAWPVIFLGFVTYNVISSRCYTRLCVWWASWWGSAGTPTLLRDWLLCGSRKPCLSYPLSRTSKNS